MDGTIFRAEALQHRLQTQGRRDTAVILPRLMTRSAFVCLWMLLILLSVGGAVVSLVRIPVNGSGVAIVIPAESSKNGQVDVAVLVSPEYGSRMEVGESVNVFTGTESADVVGIVDEVESEPLDPGALAERLALPASSLAMLDGPMVLVRVTVGSEGSSVLTPGVMTRAEIPVGSRPAGSFLPVIGRIFRSEI